MSELTETEHVTRNFLSGIINKFVLLLLPFFVRALTIKYLGNDYLGLNSLFTSILNVLNLAELGIGSAIVFFMYKPIKDNDFVIINSLVNFYRKIYYILGGIILLIGLTLTPFIDLIIEGSYPKDINIYLVYLVFLGNTCITYFCFGYKTAIFTAYQNTNVISNVSTIIHTVLYSFQIIILIFIRNYYAYIIILPLTSIINNIIISQLSRKYYPQVKPQGNLNVTIRKQIKDKTAALVGHKIGNIVISSVDSIFVSSFLGLVTLSVYSNYFYIITGLNAFMEIVTVALTASVGHYLLDADDKKKELLFKRLSFINIWIVGLCSVILLCLYQDFMVFWVGEKNTFSDQITIVFFVIYFYAWKFRIMGLLFKDAAGMWEADFYKPYIGIIADLVLNYVLVQFFGINGILIATIIIMVFLYFPVETHVLYKRLFKKAA